MRPFALLFLLASNHNTLTRFLSALSFLVGIALSFLPLGQTQAQKVGFGPKFGPAVSIYRGPMPASGMRGLQPGYSVGAYLNFKFPKNKKWQFDVNLLYTTRGNRSNFYNTVDLDETNDVYKTIVRYRVGYLEVPLIFKYMLNRGGMVRPYLMFGPTYSGIMNARLSYPTKTNHIDAREWIKRDDFGLTVGWGITGFFINHWYHLDIRYFHGFLNLSENIAADLIPFRDLNRRSDQTIERFYNSTLSLTLGVSLERPNQYFLK